MLLPGKYHRGFTLIEILVALAILAIALAALMGSTGTIAKNGVALQERTLALWVAEDVLNESRISGKWPAPGTSIGKRQLHDRDWNWELNIEQTKETNIFKAVVDVYQPGDDERVLSTLTTYYAQYERSVKLFGAAQ